MGELSRQGVAWASWPDDLIVVPEAVLWSPPNSPANVRGWTKELQNLHSSLEVDRLLWALDRYCRARGGGCESEWSSLIQVLKVRPRKPIEPIKSAEPPPPEPPAPPPEPPERKLSPGMQTSFLDMPEPVTKLQKAQRAKVGRLSPGQLAAAYRILQRVSDERVDLIPRAQPVRPTAGNLEIIAERLLQGEPEEDFYVIIQNRADELRQVKKERGVLNPAFSQYFNSRSMFRGGAWAWGLQMVPSSVPSNVSSEYDPGADDDEISVTVG